MASFTEYKDIYDYLKTDEGLKSLSQLDSDTKQELLSKINDFLNVYPKIDTSEKIGDISLRTIYQKSIKTMIDVINDVGSIISNKASLSNAQFRRQLFQVFTKKERMFYIGIWILFIAIIMYFIDVAS